MADVTLQQILHTAGKEPLSTTSGALHTQVQGTDGLAPKTLKTDTDGKLIVSHDSGLATEATLAAINTALDTLNSNVSTEAKLEAVRALVASLDNTIGVPEAFPKTDVRTSQTLMEVVKGLAGLLIDDDSLPGPSRIAAIQTDIATLTAELAATKAELESIKANQLSGDQKVQLTGTFAEDILSKVDLSNSLLALISHGQIKTVLNSWQQVQHIVRAGLHHQVFQVGDQFMALFDGEPFVWDVIGIDHDKPTDPSFTHSLTIQSHDCLLDAQFDAPEPDNPDSYRQQYGSNRYLYSAIRQWLNSAETTFTWQPQHQYDTAPTGAPYDGAGFLKLLDPELVAVLGAVDKQVNRNTVTDGGGQDLFSDKVFLLSRVEVYGGIEGETSGEAPYPYYESLAPSPTAAALDGRIKYLGSSASRWWLRSPHPSSSYSPRTVHPNGNLSNNVAWESFGVAPAVVIV